MLKVCKDRIFFLTAASFGTRVTTELLLVTCGFFVDDHFKFLRAMRVEYSTTESGTIERPRESHDAFAGLVADLQGQRPRATATTASTKVGSFSGSVQNLFIRSVNVVLLLDLLKRKFNPV